MWLFLLHDSDTINTQTGSPKVAEFRFYRHKSRISCIYTHTSSTTGAGCEYIERKSRKNIHTNIACAVKVRVSGKHSCQFVSLTSVENPLSFVISCRFDVIRYLFTLFAEFVCALLTNMNFYAVQFSNVALSHLFVSFFFSSLIHYVMWKLLITRNI